MKVKNMLSLFHSSVASINAESFEQVSLEKTNKHLPVLCHKEKFNQTQNTETFLTSKRQETKSMKHSPVIPLDSQVVKDYVMENRISTGISGLFLV